MFEEGFLCFRSDEEGETFVENGDGEDRAVGFEASLDHFHWTFAEFNGRAKDRDGNIGGNDGWAAFWSLPWEEEGEENNKGYKWEG